MGAREAYNMETLRTGRDLSIMRLGVMLMEDVGGDIRGSVAVDHLGLLLKRG